MLVLFADSDSDITKQNAKELGLKLISMPYSIDGQEVYPYETWDEFDYKPFYAKLRNGTIPKTSGLSPEKYMSYFEPEFQAGNDILYIHFSAAMSGTFNSMHIAIEELQDKYPDRKVYLIDAKGITINSYFTVKKVVEKYREGLSAEELVAYGTELAEHVATYFFTDTLDFFKHSGRISNFSAIMGGLIGIKPIIYMSQEGVMTSVSKAKGRSGAVKKLVDYAVELGDHVKDWPVIIGHSDNIELATQVGNLMKEKFGQDLEIEYVIVNPTAGSHCGPDGIGLCFHAIHR